MAVSFCRSVLYAHCVETVWNLSCMFDGYDNVCNPYCDAELLRLPVCPSVSDVVMMLDFRGLICI